METRKEYIKKIFDNVAKKYDFINHLLTAYIDTFWRNQLVKEICNSNFKGEIFLDVASGTGAIIKTTKKYCPSSVSIGIDISEKMLFYAKRKLDGKEDVFLVMGDGEFLPIKDNSIDAVFVAFGIRNMPNMENFLKETYRVLKNNGKLGILEFTPDVNPLFNLVFSLYFRKILPFIGNKIAGKNANYQYLVESVENFKKLSEIKKIIEATGFSDVYARKLTFGIVSLIVAKKI
jgi:demethylmenaquinone methyltransferase/2-methoxy-6-polyprenyl-1,4-benzoquinol methylase